MLTLSEAERRKLNHLFFNGVEIYNKVMSMRFVFLLLSVFSFSAYCGILDDFDAEALRDGFARTPLCGNREAVAICLLMPWPAGVGEGAVIVGQKGYLFLRKNKKSKELSDLLSRLPMDKQDEYAAILAVLLSKSQNIIGVAGVSSIFISWVNVTNGEITFDSISQFQMRDLLFFKSKNGDELLAKLRTATEVWSPPLDYFPKYEFSYIE